MSAGRSGSSPTMRGSAAAASSHCDAVAPGARVVAPPLWFTTALDRLVLRGRPRATLLLMAALQRLGEQGDPGPANELLGAPATTLSKWCAAQPSSAR